jgi:FkbM family methyltransferase
VSSANGAITVSRVSTRARWYSAAKERARGILGGTLTRLLSPLPAGVKVVLQEALALTEPLDYARHPIRLHVTSRAEHAYRVHSCAREPETIAWIERELRAGDVFFDVGANVGAYSLVAAKWGRAAVRVFAFEPAFATFAALSRNVSLNDCDGVVVPLPIALSDETTLGEFAYADVASGASLHAYAGHVHPKLAAFRPVLRQHVFSYRLDDLVRGWPIPVPSAIKIDVDGAELAVVRGAAETLRDARVRTLSIEIEPESKDGPEIEAFLAARGFVRRDIVPGRPNATFVRRGDV